ncbi:MULTISPECIES: NADH-quinone oxidoreductase subunit N [Flavobacterium]|uniref:NADH-quinone oxidoreductase subunit N n=1 Tax=Flavobacterium tructae TaxID=1114873 RepID=A0A1S1JA68_9FLAO|nr:MULTISPECIES: NADH-quinone oxidoreductase subunit N [Flavobacterium]MDL2141113.1 NADH-quinone oxidoreductase subunit N [Flavobacterium tructae]OHT46345.1 NADH-quinone oxidoreductase subunit N [Flavobacterium tructae]OXB22307.1 NADH-quinone oxidoreductase subunit N [Flavobacterium tructae]OXB24206.1 NADH-quinone oxidoreductase subunit N [Flavobacterium tructae]URC13856.1 NADH-quinone oxidoreductase subunit N [Flavobacterium sp. B183]
MNTLIAITGLGIFCLLFEILNLRKAIVPITIIGLLGVLALNFYEFGSTASYYNNMITVSKFSVTFSSLFIVLTIFLVALSHNFYENHPTKISDFVAIKVFLLAGGVAMVSFGNLAMFFLGIEILSIALYVLAASDRLNLKSNEAGMKYFLMGSFASGIILFGICLIYGAMGTFDVAEIHEVSLSAELPIWFPIGMILMIIGMLFKVAAVPFHFWAPDVYEGSPALTTALMSTLAKVVAIATLYKLVSALNFIPSLDNQDLLGTFETIVVIVSIASMTVGNIMALRQVNVKRMLAFSGISHAGFMLMTLLTIATSAGVLLYYTAAYALAGIAAFSVVLYVCKNQDNEDITNFHGLGKTNPLLAAILTGSLLSMAGIPIFSGFFAKLFLFNQTIQAGYIALVIVAVINSIISVGYYFKLILAMYSKEPNQERTGKPFLIYAVAVISIALNIALGLFPSLVLDLLK